ncbi:YdaS family helix-turn-helix protein [Martelella alba]|uniref:Helix-turn-helix domain-containing protein n=1 Tax=Martelella alba TaxID=2590451 RepID=A0ABY2SED5_9HYPH|nr:YdaS family helix-turn-helix protein [Martelella alba]TKI02308.1 helix-turn-helix domain-containing protein [Martelella alba]
MQSYWDNLSKTDRAALAEQVKSTPGYLRLVFKGHKKAGFDLARRLEEKTHGVITKAELRPDIYGDHIAKR